MAAQPTLRKTVPRFSRVLRRFAPQIRAQRGLLAASSVALVAQVIVRLLEPWPLKIVIDNVVVPADPHPPGSLVWVPGGETGLVVSLAAAVVVLAGLRAMFQYASTVGLALAGTRALSDVRAMVYRHLHRLPLAYHHRARSGDLITRTTNDIGRLQDALSTAIVPLVVNALLLVGTMGVMLWLNWRLALASMAVLPLFGVTLLGKIGRIRRAARKARHRDGTMSAMATESFTSIKVVQALGIEDRLEDAFAQQNKASLRAGVQGKRLTAGLERRTDVITAMAVAVALGYGAHLVRNGTVTAGDLVLFTMYMKIAFRPVRDTAKFAGRLAQAAASGERVLDVLDTEPAIRDAPDAVDAPPFRGEVRFESVSLSYEPGHPVLRDIDLAVSPGDHVALVGPSGGGKSSLLNLLPRLYEPDSGRVTIDGVDLREYTITSLRAQIGIVLQESVLFAISIRENIRFGRPDATDEDVEAAAQLANAHDFIQRLPDGYDTIVGERGATLSGGQRQRISIARAAIRNAPIMIFDEPTLGLDHYNASEVVAALRRLARGRTTLWVTHQLEAVRDSDSIAYVQEGRIAECGTHEELVETGGAYAAAYALRMEDRQRKVAVEVRNERPLLGFLTRRRQPQQK